MLFDRLGSSWASYRDHDSPLRALVVDDDAAICEVLIELLTDEGFDVVTTSTGELGWTRIEQETFDLLVVDKNLPKMSGLDLLALVDGAKIDLPAVMITGFASRDSVSAALRNGAADYISKPFPDITHVVRRLKSVAERRAADRLYARIVGDLKRALTDAVADKEELKPVARELFIFKKELGERPDVLVLSPDLAVAEVMTSTVGRLGLDFELVTTLETATARLAEPPAPLSVVVSLEVSGAVELIRSLRGEDPLLEVLVVSPDPNLKLSLEALTAGAADFVDLGAEGRAVLSVRVRRLVMAARRQRLQVHLITTLYGWLAAQNNPAAHALRAMLPESQQAYLDAAAGPLPDRPALEEEPELMELLEAEPIPLAVQAIPHVAPPVLLHAATRAAERAAANPPGLAPPATFASTRTHPRVPVELEISYRTGDHERRPARTRDVSRSGMFIITDEFIPIGTRLAIRVIGPGIPRQERIVAEGEVVHYGTAAPGATDSFGLGIQIFESPGSPYEQMVAAFEAKYLRTGST